MFLSILCSTTGLGVNETVITGDMLKIFTINVSIMAIAIYIVTLTIKRCLYDFIEKISILKRLYTIVPILLGVIFSIIPGTLPDDTIGSKILNGLVASFMASFLHSFVKKIVGVDLTIPSVSTGKKDKLVETEEEIKKEKDSSPE